MQPGGLVWELKFLVRPWDGVLPCLSLRGPLFQMENTVLGAPSTTMGAAESQSPPAVPGDSRPWGAPRKQVHTAFELCLREEWQVLGSALHDPAHQ